VRFDSRQLFQLLLLLLLLFLSEEEEENEQFNLIKLINILFN